MYLLIISYLAAFASDTDFGPIPSNEELTSYQAVIDEVYKQEMPDLAFLQIYSEDEEVIDYNAPEIHLALADIENIIFGSRGLLQIRFINDPYIMAYYDYSQQEVVISNDFINEIKRNYNRNNYLAIIHHVLAHEVSHLIMAIHCQKTNFQISPFLKKCSYSYLIEDSELKNIDLYSYYQAASAEQLDVDVLAFLIIKELEIDIEPMYDFMRSLPKPYGSSKRINDLLQSSLNQRIEFLQRQLK